MPKVLFVPDGTRTGVDAREGDSLMLAATQNGVEGIDAECGGNTSCATCHVWVSDEFAGRLDPPDELEEDLLELAVSERRDGSRLSCQVVVRPELDGLTVEIPAVQS
ncbi:2Fe-2S iron-sulfur cluster-binding protein [Pseudonocardia sp. NPDC046786]|uniref:2Fe-2S iron-sulfur cluster-binding protein n=1 Tax=Pseudonocardia sp. NPDC046786 TaxID=3155471 RepID=UPI0033D421A5